MDVLIRDTADEVAITAADIMTEHVRKGDVLGLATGSTPVKMYQELIRRHREEGLSFADSQAFLLDEYVGLAHDHEQSYYRFIRENFTAHVDFVDSRVCSPNGAAEDPAAEAAAYEARIEAAGGVGIQILGIGTNGHIGFNEPGSSLRSHTRVQALHHQTVRDNARFFDSLDDVPTHALTQGLATISSSRHPVLLATGAQKAQAVARMVEGPLSASCPASVLQLHPRVTVIVDAEAAADLVEVEHYRYLESVSPVRG
ncbi:glucosamine-6-phosphate deaminase [Corynebacterium tapiri]|uniref:Glucosamine-6-phosphate deaminase n=1 Tax=Corynebacterium tapiri TaxID=1448266 RepID=A0A5C4U412_9CORY|nr:glucosamine-6-phosphate deaminase [Corynebacterium tapiri]TNL96065.1 glucosamine-6-phosphate deaminase [Corynebacterium tapiri]